MEQMLAARPITRADRFVPAGMSGHRQPDGRMRPAAPDGGPHGLVRWCQSWDTDGALPTDMDWVRTTQFLYIRASDNKMVGTIQVRHTLNQMLAAYGGHIGYSVRPSERRKGYAARMLREVLPFCRQLGLSRVLITCTPDNEASRRVILSAGGVYESTVFEADRNRELERY